MKNYVMILTIPVLIWVSSCHSGSEPQVEETGSGIAQSGEIMLTREQFEASGMKTGAPSRRMFSNEISANGMIGSTLSGRAKINTLIPGRVRQINFSVGDHVMKGDLLFSLESYEIISLQQEYVEVVQQLNLLRVDYERQKSLADEKIVARKDFQKTESEYKRMLARSEGLKARLKMIHLNPAGKDDVTIQPVAAVYSPIEGVVTMQALVLGQFIEPRVTVMEVVNTRKLQLFIRVFEKDLPDLAVGQTVRFFSPGQQEKVYEAILSHIGASIDMDTKTVRCIAGIKPGDQGAFVNNLFVEVRIITCVREALAIPESALTRETDGDFIWIRDHEKREQITFRKIPVQTGVTHGGYTEILDEGITEVILDGSYNLWSGN